MKTARLFALILFVTRALALVSLAAPLTPAQEKIVEQIDTMAKAAEAKADAATAAETTEHADLLQAQSDTAAAQVQVAKLGSVAATAEAGRKAAVAAEAKEAAEKRRAYELLAAVIFGGLLAVASVGAELQALLRAELSAVGGAALAVIKAARLGLQAACPTLFFWL